ncbi:MAG: hypothetical protein FWG79_05830 [Bacteroidales bacterium]|nr:hypothetical protein [Bacteroidales bacterium]
MKKTLSLSIALVFATLLQAQITRNEFVTVGNSRDLAGAFPLVAGQTYSYTLPDKLHFYSKFHPNGTRAQQPGGIHNSTRTSAAWMQAKQDQRNPADYQFTVVTDGLENLSAPEIVPHNGLKAVEYTFTFPVKMELRNKDGELLRTYVLSVENMEYKITVLPDFLDDVKPGNPTATAPGAPAQSTAPVGFRQKNEDILRWINFNEAKILARMEYNTLRNISNLACDVISAGYGYPRIDGRPTVMGLNRRDVASFPELHNAIEKLKSEMEIMFNKEHLNQELSQKLKESGDFFASQYTSASSREMIQLCASNAGIAYLLANDLENTLLHLRVAEKALPTLRGGAVTAMFRQVAFINQFRNSQSVINVTPPLYLSDF